MAKLLYSLKICRLESEIQKLPAGTITTKHQLPKLRDFANFATLVYSSWWLSAGSAVDAPHNDLLLYKQILNYRAVNQTVSDSALSAFTRHLWYLTAEMVPIALFSNSLKNQGGDDAPYNRATIQVRAHFMCHFNNNLGKLSCIAFSHEK